MEMGSCRVAGRGSPASCPACRCMNTIPIPGVTQPGTIQWLNPNAFVSAVDPSTGTCLAGDNPQNCQFGNLARNALRGPDFFWSDFYVTKWFPLRSALSCGSTPSSSTSSTTQILRLPSMVLAGIPGKPSTQTGFWSTHICDLPAHRPTRRRIGRRQQPANDCVSGANRILKAQASCSHQRRGDPLCHPGQSAKLFRLDVPKAQPKGCLLFLLITCNRDLCTCRARPGAVSPNCEERLLCLRRPHPVCEPGKLFDRSVDSG